MKEWKERLKEWIYEWCISMEEWEKGRMIESERCVWLLCSGIPFNLWNRRTFNDIGGVWGEVVQLDEDINNPVSFQWGKVRIITKSREFINKVVTLECKGNYYPVRVCEEIVFPIGMTTRLGSAQIEEDMNSNSYSRQDMLSGTIEGRREPAKEGEGGDDVSLSAEVVSRVKDTVEGGKSELEGRGSMGAASSLRPTDEGLENSKAGGSGNVGMLKFGESPREKVAGSIQNIDANIFTPGFMKSLSGLVMERLKINLQVVLKGVQGEANQSRPNDHSWSNLSDYVAQTQFNRVGSSAALKDGESSCVKVKRRVISRKRGNKGRERGVLLKGKSLPSQRGRVLPQSFNRGAIFRATAAALSNSLSIKSESSSRSRRLIKEAKATVQMGQSLGINFEGKEVEAIEKIVKMESKDLEKIEGRGMAVDA